MEITIEHIKEGIAVMHIKGDINASNFMQVYEKAREIHNNPVSNLILDLSAVPNISSSGVVGVHKIALLYSGETQEVERNENPDFTHVSSARKHVRLLSPQSTVAKTLHDAGMRLFFKTFNNLEEAINSF